MNDYFARVYPPQDIPLTDGNGPSDPEPSRRVAVSSRLLWFGVFVLIAVDAFLIVQFLNNIRDVMIRVGGPIEWYELALRGCLAGWLLVVSMAVIGSYLEEMYYDNKQT